MAWKDYNQRQQDQQDMTYLFLLRLTNLLEMRDVAFIEGDHIRAFRCLKAIYSNIIGKVKEKGNEDEEEKLAQAMRQGEIKLKNWLFVSEKGAKAQAAYTFERVNDEINIWLNELLYSYELIFPKPIKRDIAYFKAKLQEAKVREPETFRETYEE